METTAVCTHKLQERERVRRDKALEQLKMAANAVGEESGGPDFRKHHGKLLHSILFSENRRQVLLILLKQDSFFFFNKKTRFLGCPLLVCFFSCDILLLFLISIMPYETLKRGDSLLALLTLSYFVCFCSGRVIDRIQPRTGTAKKTRRRTKGKTKQI